MTNPGSTGSLTNDSGHSASLEHRPYATQDDIHTLLGSLLPDKWETTCGPVWRYVRPKHFTPRTQGWKLHVSCTGPQLAGVLADITPIAFRYNCRFKVARSQAILERINDGHTSPPTVGKAFTLYPADDAGTVAIGWELVRAVGWAYGPKILSDLRISTDAPVYYRYGPFSKNTSVSGGEDGRAAAIIFAPDGSALNGLASLRYEQPPWVVNPFEHGGQARVQRLPGHTPPLLGGRYRVMSGIQNLAAGMVARGVDTKGNQVIIKQARPHVGGAGGHGPVARLRNERLILNALSGLACVPQYIDHFTQGGDEYLVTSDAGTLDLRAAVNLHGRFRDSDPARSLRYLWEELRFAVQAIHERGVIIRDISPKNIVINGRRVTIVDFGISAYDGALADGGTPGYSPVQQFNRRSHEGDDFYALGMTMLFAATGLDPIAPELLSTAAVRLQETLSCLSRSDSSPQWLLDIVHALASDNAKACRAIMRRPAQADGAQSSIPGQSRRVQGSNHVAISHDEIEALKADQLNILLTQSKAILTDARNNAAEGWASDLYAGVGGIALELCRHGESIEGVNETAADLGTMARRLAPLFGGSAGFLIGTTGIEVCLRELYLRELAYATLPDEIVFSPRAAKDDDPGLLAGATGVAIAHLVLYSTDHNHRHLELAKRIARSTSFSPPSTISRTDRMGHREALAAMSTGGVAHGFAGYCGLLGALASRDESFLLDARRAIRQLASHCNDMCSLLASRDAAQISVSWCRGLTGVAGILLDVGQLLNDRTLVECAIAAAKVCHEWVPLLANPGQCCGLSGVGTMFCRVAEVDDSGRFEEAIFDVTRQLLSRSVEPGLSLRFRRAQRNSLEASWAAGTAGVLQFLRTASRATSANCLAELGAGFMFPRS